MAAAAAALGCMLAAWTAVGPGVRLAEGRCGASRAWLVEVDPAAGAGFLVSPPGPGRTTPEFARETGAAVALGGGLFDVRERPMGPARGQGRDWPLSPRQASAGVFGAAGGRVALGGLESWMTDAVSGWPELVSRGAPCVGRCGCPRRETLCTDPAARVAVGLAGGRVLLAVIEAPGVTLPELARWLVSLGAEHALNLDGGGSTSLVVAGDTLTGGGLRLPVHLGVLAAATNPPRERKK